MKIGNQFKCYPSPAQAQVLLQWIGCQRHIYNAKVREDRYFRSFARKSLNHVGIYAPIDQQYSHFKSELTPFLSEVPSQVLRNGASKWKEAYSRYFSKGTIKFKAHKTYKTPNSIHISIYAGSWFLSFNFILHIIHNQQFTK